MSNEWTAARRRKSTVASEVRDDVKPRCESLECLRGRDNVETNTCCVRGSIRMRQRHKAAIVGRFTLDPATR